MFDKNVGPDMVLLKYEVCDDGIIDKEFELGGHNTNDNDPFVERCDNCHSAKGLRNYVCYGCDIIETIDLCYQCAKELERGK